MFKPLIVEGNNIDQRIQFQCSAGKYGSRHSCGWHFTTQCCRQSKPPQGHGTHRWLSDSLLCHTAQTTQEMPKKLQKVLSQMGICGCAGTVLIHIYLSRLGYGEFWRQIDTSVLCHIARNHWAVSVLWQGTLFCWECRCHGVVGGACQKVFTLMPAVFPVECFCVPVVHTNKTFNRCGAWDDILTWLALVRWCSSQSGIDLLTKFCLLSIFKT